MPAFSTILIANRGEIACRVLRSAHDLGYRTVAVYSDAEPDARHVALADRALCIGPAPVRDSYLSIDAILDAARRAGADAIHPGYGFLSENEEFAAACAAAGITFIGPPEAAIRLMGNKAQAKLRMIAAGVPCVPGYSGDGTPEGQSDARLLAEAANVGFPLLIKAAAGGGGRGMRLVKEPGDLRAALASARSEAKGAFGSDEVILERAVVDARHVEIQVFADSHGRCVHLGERDCSIQRRHQKIVEEAPSPVVDGELRAKMGAAAVQAARAIGYLGAGTVEFLLDAEGHFYFLEMNTRLQVEHPVTEMVTGLDLVELQLRVAMGEPLPAAVLAGVQPCGHAIEVRLCAEDPYAGYLPSSGTFSTFSWPVVDGLRIDSAVEAGSEVPPHYDSMIAKVIAYGADRAEAARKLAMALDRADVCGPTTNRPLLRWLAGRLVDIDGEVDTGWLDRQDLGAAPAPSPLEIAAAAVALARGRAGRYPIGWRNNASQLHAQALRLGDNEHLVQYRFDRSDRLEVLHVDGEPVELDDFTQDALARVRVRVEGDTVYVGGGRFAFAVPPRFVSPDEAGRAGSTVAPMPGKVVRLLVAAGDTVAAGQPMLTIEAMKMEHQIVAPHAGTVVEVFVAAGQQLDHGQPLVKVDAS